jgi:hypothetical protein
LVKARHVARESNAHAVFDAKVCLSSDSMFTEVAIDHICRAGERFESDDDETKFRIRDESTMLWSLNDCVHTPTKDSYQGKDVWSVNWYRPLVSADKFFDDCIKPWAWDFSCHYLLATATIAELLGLPPEDDKHLRPSAEEIWKRADTLKVFIARTRNLTTRGLGELQKSFRSWAMSHTQADVYTAISNSLTSGQAYEAMIDGRGSSGLEIREG